MPIASVPDEAIDRDALVAASRLKEGIAGVLALAAVTDLHDAHARDLGSGAVAEQLPSVAGRGRRGGASGSQTDPDHAPLTDQARLAVNSDEVPRLEGERRFGVGDPTARQHAEPQGLPRLHRRTYRRRSVKNVDDAGHLIAPEHHVEIPSGAMRQGA